MFFWRSAEDFMFGHTHSVEIFFFLPSCCLSGVGSNLQDHLELYVQQKCTQPITLYKAQKPFQMVKIGLEWFTLYTGKPGTNTHTHSPSGQFFTGFSPRSSDPRCSDHLMNGRV